MLITGLVQEINLSAGDKVTWIASLGLVPLVTMLVWLAVYAMTGQKTRHAH